MVDKSKGLRAVTLFLPLGGFVLVWALAWVTVKRTLLSPCPHQGKTMEHPPRTLFGTLLIMGHMLGCKESNDTGTSRIYRVSGQAGDSESSKGCLAQDPGKAMFQSEYKDWGKADIPVGKLSRAAKNSLFFRGGSAFSGVDGAQLHQ